MASTGRRLCGARVVRCTGCEKTVGSWYIDRCPKCGGNEIVESTCQNALAGDAIRCSKHGGKAPQVLHRQAMSNLEGEANRILIENGCEPVTDPVSEIQVQLGKKRKVRDQVGEHVNAMQSYTTLDLLGRENLRVMFDTYIRLDVDYTNLLVASAKLNIDGRVEASRIRVDKAIGDLIYTAVMGAVHAFIPAEAESAFKKAILAEIDWTNMPPDERGPQPVHEKWSPPAPKLPAAPPQRPVEALAVTPAPVAVSEPAEAVQPAVVVVEGADLFDDPPAPVSVRSAREVAYADPAIAALQRMRGQR